MTIHRLAQGSPASNGPTEAAGAPNSLTELRRGDTVTADCPTGAAGAANRSTYRQALVGIVDDGGRAVRFDPDARAFEAFTFGERKTALLDPVEAGALANASGERFAVKVERAAL